MKSLFSKFNYTFLTPSVFALFLLLGACKKTETVAPSTTGGIAVKFEVRFSNGTVLPLSELSNWNINVEIYAGTTSNPIKTQKATSSSGVTFTGLAPNTYDVECDGVVTYRGQVLTASGSSGVQVLAGNTATTTVNLQ